MFSKLGGGGENVKAEVDIQIPLIAQILQNLGFTADPAEGTNKQRLQINNANLQKVEDYLPHGQYVWKKYKIVEETFSNPSFNFDTRSDSTIYPISSTTFDTTKVSEAFFDGFSFTLNVDGTIYTQSFVYADGELHAIGGYFGASASANNRFVYDAQNSKFTGASIGTTRIFGTATYTGEKKFSYNTFQTFVVSNIESEYPDVGTQNGYWYERFDSAVEGINFGYVTLTSAQSSVTVAHSLGKTPRGAMITLIEGVANDSTQRTQGRSFFGNIFTNLYRNSSIFAGLYSIYNSMSEVPSNGYPFTMGTEEITFTCYVNLKFKAGKYLWIAIA